MRILFFLCVLGFGSSFALAERVVNLANGEWPPYLSESYKNYGVASDIVSKAFEAQGIRVNYGFFPWKRGYEFARLNPDWHGTLIWTYSEERAAEFLYSDVVITLNDVFFHRSDKPFDWDSMDDLKGLTVGATLGYFYGSEFEKAEQEEVFSVDRVPDDVTNLKKLMRGRIDVFPLTTEVGYELVFDTFPESSRHLIINHKKPIRSSSYHLILSKNIDENAKLLEEFNQGLKKIKANGVYEKLIEQSIVGWYRPEGS